MVCAASSRESAWIRWLPTNPAAPVTSTTPDSLGPLTVLFLVVVAKRRVPVLDRSPPPLVGPVPLDRSPQAVAERHLWCPTQGTQLGGVQAVPAVVAGPVGHRPGSGSWAGRGSPGSGVSGPRSSSRGRRRCCTHRPADLGRGADRARGSGRRRATSRVRFARCRKAAAVARRARW